VHQVDDVASEQVLREQDFTGTTLKSTKVNSVAFKAHPAGGEAANLANRDKEVTTFDAHDGPHDWRVGMVTHSGHEVANSADAVTVYVVERAP
jgi:hypothetical protein